MTTAVEIVRREAPIAVREWGDERVAVVVEQLMRTPDETSPPTPAEVELFALRCQATGLDPFSGQIHAIYRRDRRSGLGRTLTMQVGIDGFRLVAARSGDLDGQDGPEWQDRDGAWLDSWPHPYPPVAARVLVYRRGASRPWRGVVNFAEYVQTWDGRATGLWASMPANQLAKCAEAQALRKAFPAELGHVYEPSELDRSDPSIPPETADERAQSAAERAGDQRISRDQTEAIVAEARSALLTRGEVRGILEDVADVGQPAHVRRRDYQDVLDAIRAKAHPAASGDATIGEPTIVPDGVPVDDAEAVEPDPVVAPEAEADDAGSDDEDAQAGASDSGETGPSPNAARGATGGGEVAEADTLGDPPTLAASLLDEDDDLADSFDPPTSPYGRGGP